MYSRYIDFPMSMYNEKKYASPFFFSDIANVFFDSHKVMHHSHVTREKYGEKRW